MKRLSAVVLASALVMNCGGSGSEPSGGGSTPSTTTYTVTISPAAEIPAVTNGDQSITGTATIKITATKDGNTVKSATVDYQVTASGFPAGTTITGAHIHTGGSAVSGGIFHNPGVTSSDMPISGGSGSFTKNGLTLNAADAQAILNNPSAFYFNLHTALNPGGAARGQLAAGGSPNDPGSGGGNPNPY
jgi:CHRD domain-containing protein